MDYEGQYIGDKQYTADQRKENRALIVPSTEVRTLGKVFAVFVEARTLGLCEVQTGKAQGK
jgi:hypothetical protein